MTGDAAEGANARPAARAGALSLAFARVSRAVRLTVALEARVEQDARAPARAVIEAAARAEDHARRAVDAEAQRRRESLAAIAQEVTEAVEGLIEDAAFADEAAGDRLYEDLVERVDALDEDEMEARPTVELIARICGDLGLEPDWDLWADEDWIEEAGGVRAARLAWKKAAGAGTSAGLRVPAPALEARPP
jgi:fused signal recognition particle receptor